MKNVARPFRQGDVLLVPVSENEMPKTEGKVVDRDRGRVVLAYGERTGHSHAIPDQNAVLMSFDLGNSRTERYLKAEAPVCLYHEEHDPVELPSGFYRVTIHREYSPEEIRNVAD